MVVQGQIFLFQLKRIYEVTKKVAPGKKNLKNANSTLAFYAALSIVSFYDVNNRLLI